MKVFLARQFNYTMTVRLRAADARSAITAAEQALLTYQEGAIAAAITVRPASIDRDERLYRRRTYATTLLGGVSEKNASYG
ncbi:hypothetical protein FHR32_003167 [Streptosporangium album]|uniref:Uncharacterized protein n=1 Tax=Streptosporangium album TaxID=47479 RepID=A0A7W7W900_9ACTN|nr:hypothetical protein [Streptosporangium album]MBB4938862.1 hypothetical protein [Streptosporangium album]